MITIILAIAYCVLTQLLLKIGDETKNALFKFIILWIASALMFYPVYLMIIIHLMVINN